MHWMNVMFAMSGTGGGTGGGGGGGGMGSLITFLPLILIFIIAWMLMIRPQRKRENERKSMLEQLKKSDHVLTIGGIHGVVTQIRGDEVVLKVDETNNVKITFTRSAIARIIDKSAEPAAPEAAEKPEK